MHETPPMSAASVLHRRSYHPFFRPKRSVTWSMTISEDTMSGQFCARVVRGTGGVLRETHVFGPGERADVVEAANEFLLAQAHQCEVR